ncbi:hypothetical protein G5B30_09880 [Sphingobacterium sp. SGG-5]|uniref:HmuY family protein n=1 Tax=Sphingobacterium sp. SGG-5 TaxID=2710881 RepID=UPI0013EDECB2|nr:HmuY family protein [Sphingobacterium sp. SGG-5]NGM62223.1 hypothetical protein [Sphingobacterium sp. SGG-5]
MSSLILLKNSLRAALLIGLLATVTVQYACDKDNTVPEDTGKTDNYYKLIRVKNLPIAPTDEGSTPNPDDHYLYSLSENRTIPIDSANSTKWDLAFGGMFTSFLSANNGNDDDNYGKGSGGKGEIAIVESTFDEVTEIPQNLTYHTGKDIIGTDDQGFFGNGIGWYLYDFNGTYVREGAAEDQHVAYALAEPITKKDGTTVQPRTVILKTAKGDYAKIKMISCYKDLFSQELWKKGEPIMYATFEYILIPAGSTKFEIK